MRRRNKSPVSMPVIGATSALLFSAIPTGRRRPLRIKSAAAANPACREAASGAVSSWRGWARSSYATAPCGSAPGARSRKAASRRSIWTSIRTVRTIPNVFLTNPKCEELGSSLPCGRAPRVSSADVCARPRSEETRLLCAADDGQNRASEAPISAIKPSRARLGTTVARAPASHASHSSGSRNAGRRRSAASRNRAKYHRRGRKSSRRRA
jgi:hypothetical protein